MKSTSKFLAAVIYLSLTLQPLQAQWTATNAPCQGGIRVLVVSGTNLFAGTDGGIFLSPDNGTSWTAASTGLTNTVIYALAVSGTDLFAATHGGGVFHSADNGTTWTPVNTGLTNLFVSGLVATGTDLFAGTSGGGIFRSSDNGANWSQVNNGLTNVSVTSLAASGTDLIAGTTTGIFRSTDNGASWSAASSGMTGAPFIERLVVIGTRLFALTDNNSVFLSTNNGTQWTSICSLATVQDIAAFGTQLFAGTVFAGVYVSPDSGATWLQVNSGMTGESTNIWSLAVSGSYLVAGTWSGIWRRPLSEVCAVLPAPVLESPANNIIINPDLSRFEWTASNVEALWHLQISIDSSFSSISVDQKSYSSSFPYIGGLANNTTYYWHVRAITGGGTSPWSAMRRFTTVVSAPKLAFPAHLATGISNDPELTWYPSEGATSYRLRLSTGYEMILDQSGITSTSYTVKGLEDNTTYYWQVNAVSDGVMGYSSAIRTFTTVLSLPRQVSLISPSNGSLLGADSVRFIWHTASPSVAFYEVELTRDSTVTAMSLDTAITLKVPAGRSLQAYSWKVRAQNLSGFGPYSDSWSILKQPTSVSASGSIPKDYVLLNNYPNPFNPSTTFSFSLPRTSFVLLKVYDAFGRDVAVIISEELPAGQHSRQWNASGASSGVYFYRLQAGNYTETKRLVLLK